MRLRNRKLVPAATLVLLAAGGIFLSLLQPQVDRTRIWRVGYNNAYPYYTSGPDGRPDGFAFEAIDEAASREGVRLEWVFVDGGPEDAFQKYDVDLWPRLSASRDRSQWHITEPWMRMSFCLITPRARGARLPNKTTPATVAHDGSTGIARTANSYLQNSTQKVFPSPADAMAAVCTGEADAAFFEFRTGQAVLISRPEACRDAELLPVPLEGVTVSVGLGAQMRAKAAAERLRHGLEELWQDGTLARLQTKWFLSPPSEVETILESMASRKMASFLWGGIGMLAVILALTLKQVQAARRARKAAERASAAKSELVANISHEIRTPMNGVMGMAALLADSTLSHQQQEMVETIQTSASSLLAVLNDILDYSKIEAGRFSIEDLDMDLRAVVEGVVALLRGGAIGKGIGLEMTWDPLVPQYVRGDCTRVRQVLLNLVGNAIKFTSEGKVTVDVASRGDMQNGALVRISVTDTGIGIAPETAEQLFRPYTQADSTMTRKYGGTGLGLAISKQLVRLMGGDIGVNSELGKGSTFWITIPFHIASMPVTRAPEVSSGIPQQERRGRILLVEDNPVNAKITTRLLEKMGHHIMAASNGHEACQAFHHEAFDLILMDVMMPEMDGLQATKEIRRMEATGHRRTPIVALTASAMESDRKRCEEAGMDDYLTKPLSTRQLAEKVQRWLEVSQPIVPLLADPALREEVGAKAARMPS
ncbi:MAG: response regulator [Bryobacterales bacterium]|nr:response regulator [Bryobacterales bacterium]